MYLSCTVFEIKRETGQKSPVWTNPTCVWRPFWVTRRNFAEMFGVNKLECLPGLTYDVDCVILRLPVLVQCRRVTDKRTQDSALITSHSNTYVTVLVSFDYKENSTTQNAFCPSTLSQWESVLRSSMTLATFYRDSRSKVTVSLPRAQDRTLQLIIVVCSPESVLPDVLAIHTIEMIPKSMIVTST